MYNLLIYIFQIHVNILTENVSQQRSEMSNFLTRSIAWFSPTTVFCK